MWRWIVAGVFAALIGSMAPTFGQAVKCKQTDQQIAALIVQASRNAYYATGRPCACPEDRMRNGRRCGKNSAYSRPGGVSPDCYVREITKPRITAYRKRLGC